MARVYEKEKNFGSALEEIDRYVSLSGEENSSLPLKMISKALIYHNSKGSIEDCRSWLEIFIKRASSENEKTLAEIKLLLLKGRTGKVSSLIKALSEAEEKYELAARAMVLDEKEGSEINSSAEGRYKTVFDAILNEGNADQSVVDALDSRTFIFIRLAARNSAGSKLKDAVLSGFSNSTLFVCSECGGSIEASFPVCRNCLKITGRRFNIISGD